MKTSLLARLAAASLALATITAAAPSHAQAQSVDISRPHTGSRPFQLDVHAGLAWWGFGVASGVRFGIPLVENGFVTSINNAVYLNFGADFYFIRHRRSGGIEEYDPGFGIPVALHWEFYFNETWSAFAELGVNVWFHPAFFRGRDFFDNDYGGAWFLAAIGGRLHINNVIALTVRVGSPYASFGITFLI